MDLVAFLIFFVILLSVSFAQCPKDEKPSKLLPEKCLKSNVCDGYVSRIKPNVCQQKDITINTSEDSKFIKCEIAEGKDAEYTLYICDECIRLGEYRIQCNNCQDDEYYLTYQPGKCIKKFEFGTNPTYLGYLNDDYATIISKCKPNQIITEHSIHNKDGSQIIRQPLCLTCPKEKPLVSTDKTTCTEIYDDDYIKDLRDPSNQTVMKRSSCSFFSSDALACVTKCQPDEITYQITENVKICKFCFGQKPFPSLDKTSCLSECPQGTFLSEDQKTCIQNANCTGFINVNRRVCYKNEQCQPKQIGNIPMSFNPKNTKQCFDCPENKVIIQNTQCSGCPPNQTLVLSVPVCLAAEVFLNEEKKRLKEIELGISLKGTFNTPFTVLYPPNYCPPQHKIKIGIAKLPKQEYCYPCATEYSKIQQNQCCDKGQFFDKINFKCVQECEIVGTDFTCLSQCKEDEVLKQVQYEYELDGKYYKKQINQCISCNDPRVYLEDVPSNIPVSTQQLLKKCIYVRQCGPQKNNTNLYKNLCSQSKKQCPSFSPFKGEPSIYYEKVSDKCVQCPLDKPFLELQDNSFRCTRCLTKIRDYVSGMCVEDIGQIFNPGAGVFKYNRLEYWPKSECSNSQVQFNYKYMGLKECYQIQQQQSDCKLNQIYDQRTKTCIDQPEKCSLVLSSDRSICELYPCKSDEFYQTLIIDKNDPQFAIKTNNGYLYQCQSLILCPADKPYIQSGICTAACNQGYILYNKTCITQKECPKIVSRLNTKCVDKCEIQEIYYKNKENILQCFACDSSTPNTLNNNCLKECPEKYATDDNFECNLFSECKGAIYLYFNQCRWKCPYSDPFEQEDSSNSFKICVDKCYPGYYVDRVTSQCIREEMCKKFLISQLCVDECPIGTGKRKRENSNIIDCISCSNEQMFYQGGFCKKVCSGDQIGDENTFQCINYYDCKSIISQDKKYCVNQCSFGQEVIKISQFYPMYKCENCPSDKPNSDGYGNNQFCTNKCKIIDVNGTDLSCLPFFHSCKSYLFEQPDGTYTCEKNCPQIGFIQEKYNERSNTPYVICKKCPENAPTSYQNKCYAECPLNSRLIISETQPPYCEKCPNDKPNADFDGQVQICRNKCRILNNNNKCLRDFQSCNNTLILQSDGTYTCEKFCPQFGFAKEKICNEKGEQCYFLCKKCPQNSPFAYKGECFTECPSPSISIPDFKQCIHICPIGQLYDLDEEQCNNFHLAQSTTYFGMLDNIRVLTRECPTSLKYEIVCVPNFFPQEYSQTEKDYFSSLTKSQLDKQISPAIFQFVMYYIKRGTSPIDTEMLIDYLLQFDPPSIFISKSRMYEISNILSSDFGIGKYPNYNSREIEEVRKLAKKYANTCVENVPICQFQTQSKPSKEESTESRDISGVIKSEIKSQSKESNEGGRNDGYSNIEIIIICICGFAVIQFVVFIVYYVHKRMKERNSKMEIISLKKENSNRNINLEEQKMANCYTTPTTVTNLNDEIESEQNKEEKQISSTIHV